MLDLEAAAEIAGELVKGGETVAVSESSTGGLVSAALLAIPGASRFFRAGAVIYTLEARRALLGVSDAALDGVRPASETYALRLGHRTRELLGVDWVVAESGATGPDGNRYGDPPGHCAIAVVGPVERVATLETGDTDRVANMERFAGAALGLLVGALRDRAR